MGVASVERKTRSDIMPEWLKTSLGNFVLFPLFVLIIVTWGMAFVLARAYVVVEACISLRQAPIGAFWVPSWLQMVPHI